MRNLLKRHGLRLFITGMCIAYALGFAIFFYYGIPESNHQYALAVANRERLCEAAAPHTHPVLLRDPHIMACANASNIVLKIVGINDGQ